MSTIVINVPQETYRRLQEEARKAGKAPEVLTRELLEISLQAREESRQRTARGILQASERARPLGERLRNKIIPGVTLDEVRESLTKAGGPPLSEIVLTQRGAKL
ncbi:MAG: hypothetical protein Q8O86_11400 [Dehalococcoidia bacterium]|nr:hypothetical protein [Dehalococcoidia bacterium]